MKNAGMAGAVALVGIGLITIGLSNFANRADATPAATVNAGPEDPVIVAFGSLGLGFDGQTTSRIHGGFYRLWSDGSIEVRIIGLVSNVSLLCSSVIQSDGACGDYEPLDSGWVTLPDPPGGDGFACRTDINGDRDVNAEDLGLLLAQWGQEISCDPQPSYPCFDLNGLNGLNMNIAAR